MVEWVYSQHPVEYALALRTMESRVDKISANKASEAVWLLEHPPIYTAGTSSDGKELTQPDRFPVYKAGRGGRYTYHGPGQRVVYLMLNLNRRERDIRKFTRDLETWLKHALGEFGVRGESKAGRTGIWVVNRENGREGKIAAIGIRVRKWITWHGVSVNVAPNLDHFSGIVPCGIADHGVTSLADMGLKVSMNEMDRALRQHFEVVFAPDRHQIANS